MQRAEKKWRSNGNLVTPSFFVGGSTFAEANTTSKRTLTKFIIQLCLFIPHDNKSPANHFTINDETSRSGNETKKKKTTNALALSVIRLVSFQYFKLLNLFCFSSQDLNMSITVGSVFVYGWKEIGMFCHYIIALSLSQRLMPYTVLNNYFEIETFSNESNWYILLSPSHSTFVMTSSSTRCRYHWYK